VGVTSRHEAPGPPVSEAAGGHIPPHLRRNPAETQGARGRAQVRLLKAGRRTEPSRREVSRNAPRWIYSPPVMAAIRDDDLPGETGISSTERRAAAAPPRTAPVTEELLKALPKTDLHCHLDGSMRLSTILELAKEQGVKLPANTEEGLAKAIHMGEVCESLDDYLVAFDVTLSVLQTAPALERAAYELAIDAAAENVRWLEVRYSPALHMEQGLKMTEIIDAVLEGLRRAKRETGIKTGVIICGIRHIDPQMSLRLAELCVAYKNRGVIGFDLAGAELNFPAKDHQRAFQIILKNNVNCTAHAGEAFGPESISQAIHSLGSHRIGHGVR